MTDEFLHLRSVTNECLRASNNRCWSYFCRKYSRRQEAIRGNPISAIRNTRNDDYHFLSLWCIDMINVSLKFDRLRWILAWERFCLCYFLASSIVGKQPHRSSLSPIVDSSVPLSILWREFKLDLQVTRTRLSLPCHFHDSGFLENSLSPCQFSDMKYKSL